MTSGKLQYMNALGTWGSAANVGALKADGSATTVSSGSKVAYGIRYTISSVSSSTKTIGVGKFVVLT